MSGTGCAGVRGHARSHRNRVIFESNGGLRLAQAPQVIIALLNQSITLLQQLPKKRTLRTDPQGGLIWTDFSVMGQRLGIDSIGFGFDADGPCERSGSLSGQSSLMVMLGIAGAAASCSTIRAPTWRASSW